jgi:hypothetical protein
MTTFDGECDVLSLRGAKNTRNHWGMSFSLFGEIDLLSLAAHKSKLLRFDGSPARSGFGTACWNHAGTKTADG